jgi:hypothetical protein
MRARADDPPEMLELIAAGRKAGATGGPWGDAMEELLGEVPAELADRTTMAALFRVFILAASGVAGSDSEIRDRLLGSMHDVAAMGMLPGHQGVLKLETIMGIAMAALDELLGPAEPDTGEAP